MIGTRLQQLRNQKGLSQEALAALSGLSVRTIQRIEAGVSTPRAFTIKVLIDSLEVDREDLVKEEVETKDPRQDFQAVRLMNLSVLSQLLLPLANIFLPLLIWSRRKKQFPDQVWAVKMISFQICWTCLSLCLLVAAPMLSVAIFGQVQVGQFPLVGAVYFSLIFMNIALSFYISSKPDIRAAQVYRYAPTLF